MVKQIMVIMFLGFVGLLSCFGSAIITNDISMNSTEMNTILMASKTIGNSFHIDESDLTYYRTEEKGSGILYSLGNSNYSFYVNPKTGRVDRAIFPATSTSGKVQISWDEAERKAKTYALQYYPNFSSMNLSLTDKYQNNNDNYPSYSFKWFEIKDGVRTPNYFLIMVSAVNGEIIAYNSEISPILVTNVKPSITKEEAEKIARQKWAEVKLSKLTSVLAINYIGPGKQALVWEVVGEGEVASGVTSYGFGDIILVDAINGTVIPYYI